MKEEDEDFDAIEGDPDEPDPDRKHDAIKNGDFDDNGYGDWCRDQVKMEFDR